MSRCLAALLLLTASTASGYLVGASPSLTQVAGKADLIVKAVVVSEAVVCDPAFRELSGFEVVDTTLKVVSTLKGPTDAAPLRFRHYTPKRGGDVVFMYSPQNYTLARGRTYVVFAIQGKDGGYQQLWQAHTSKEDQGVYLAADDRPHVGHTVTEAIWNELTHLLRSGSPADVMYAIHQLDSMSGTSFRHSLQDFDRLPVLQAIGARIGDKDLDVALAAITAIGGESPYLDDTQAEYWLAGIGKGLIQGLSPRTPTGKSTAADLHRPALLAVANGPGPVKLRALAIRALGHGVRWAPVDDTARWLKDPDPLVRQAAVILLADSPGESATRAITAAAHDPAPELRLAAARATGFSQSKDLLPLLGKLLQDPVPLVVRGAAMSLLSFDVVVAAPVLKANLDGDFRSIFVNALARRDPAAHVAALGDIIARQLEPKNFWGGRIPAADAWEILFKHVQSLPAGALQSHQHDATLDSLEKMRWYSSGEPSQLYGFYLQRGLPDRARRFRAACKKTVSFDMETYFNAIDRNPSQ